MSHKREPTPGERTSYPWMGKVLAWSAVLRAQPIRHPSATYHGRLIDIPRDTPVTVLGQEQGWLKLEVTVKDKPYKGYVSAELIEYVAPKLNASTDKVALYRAFVQSGFWNGAVGLLTTFSEKDRQTLLQELGSAELAAAMRAALLLPSLYAPSQLFEPSARSRVTDLITQLNPTAAATGQRWANATQKLREVEGQAWVSVVSREAWGAREHKQDDKWVEYPSDAPLPLTNIVIHHTADPLNQTVKELQDKEMNDGYSDMPYHFVITSDGRIHEGRVIGAVGAHAGEIAGNTDIKKDPDYGSVGIVLTGDFESRKENLWSPDKPTAAQRESLQRLLNHLVAEYAIPPQQILRHSQVKRSGKPKVCPGANLSLYIDAMKAKATGYLAQRAAAQQELQTTEALARHLAPSRDTRLQGALKTR